MADKEACDLNLELIDWIFPVCERGGDRMERQWDWEEKSQKTEKRFLAITCIQVQTSGENDLNLR